MRFSSTRSYSKAGAPLSNDEVRALAPSAFAADAHQTRSSRYTYIPTVDVLDGFRAAGFVPTHAAQSRARDIAKREHTKHMIRFREAGVAPTVDGLCPEIVLVNSHDGSSAYQLYAGMYRFVCANGLMVGQTFESARIRHQGDALKDVIDASYTIISESRRALGQAKQMMATPLTRSEQIVFAEAAHQLRFEGSETGAGISAVQLLRARRAEDIESNVFSTLNVLQENTMRGGLRGWTRDEHGNQRRVTSRAVGGIDQNTSLNRALWTVAEKMMELKH